MALITSDCGQICRPSRRSSSAVPSGCDAAFPCPSIACSLPFRDLQLSIRCLSVPIHCLLTAFLLPLGHCRMRPHSQLPPKLEHDDHCTKTGCRSGSWARPTCLNCLAGSMHSSSPAVPPCDRPAEPSPPGAAVLLLSCWRTRSFLRRCTAQMAVGRRRKAATRQ